MALDTLNSMVIGAAVFAVSFIVLYIAWSIFLRVTQSFFSKSKFYFIPRLLKEIGSSVMFVILLVSVYLGIHFYDPALLDGTMIKIWGILLILVITEMVARILLSTMDIYRAKLRGAPTFLSNRIPLLKTLVGLVIYGIAILVVINYLSSEIGSVVTLIGLLFLAVIFVISYEPVKNIVAGMQLPDRMQEGDYVEVAGRSGFVEKVLDQYTIIRDIDGKSVTVPNSRFVKEVMRNSFFSEGNLICMRVRIAGNGKARERLTGVCGKVALKLDDVFNDYNPKVFLTGLENGAGIYVVKFITAPNADMRKITDAFISAIRDEFKNSVTEIRME